ncbi:MAG: putative Ig domain-containing protein [Betaproteobacteria bacterium]|nr:putative Ig domain-containing protein [Betaproteobacteria bacterium]
MPTLNLTGTYNQANIPPGGLTYTIVGNPAYTNNTVDFLQGLQSNFTIIHNTDSSITVDSVSGASSPYNLTLKDIRYLKFASDTVTVDLSTYFGQVAPLVATLTAGQNATVGTPFQLTLPASTFTDTNSGANPAYTATLADGSALPAWLGFNASTLTFSGTPTSASTLSLALTLTDSYGLSATDNFTLTVKSSSATITAPAGNSPISGQGSGLNTVVYSGNLANYTISNAGSGFTVTDNSGTQGTHALSNIQRIKFADYSLALDMGTTQSGGQAAEILGAAFGTSAVGNTTYAGIALKLFDSGQSMAQVAQLALGTGLLPTSSNTAFVSAVWQNVMGTPIDSGNLATFTGLLNNHTLTQASLLAMAATTSFNQTHIGLTGLATHGLEYLPA